MADAWALSETQAAVRDTVREFAAKHVAPGALKADEEGRFPRELFSKMGELGLLGIPVPVQYGGLGADTLSFALALEELARACPSTALTLAAHTSLATMTIVARGTEEQKKRLVPPLVRGDHAGALCLTEPDAGSDVAGARLRAVRSPEGYGLHGAKIFVTNGTFAGALVASAVTDPSAERHRRLSAFVVGAPSKGLEVSRTERKLGMRASETSEVRFDGVVVPEENRLGVEGDGFEIFMETLVAGRIGISAIALGIAEEARDRAAVYATRRRQFDRPIADFQAVQFLLADMEKDIEAARLLIHRSASLKDAGAPFAREASIAKLHCGEMAVAACRNAIQILGGSGFMSECGLERLYRDAKLCEIGEGTNEIQRILIARHVLGRVASGNFSA